MDIKLAAIWSKKYITYINELIPLNHPEYGVDHLNYMADKLISGEISGEKAHRWLGWLQACICVGNGATLEELKLINKEA